MVVHKEAQLRDTIRNVGKFGSTGKSVIAPPQAFESTTASLATIHDDNNIKDTHLKIELSNNPYNDEQEIVLTTLGKHPTQGLILEQRNERYNRVNIKSCKPGTASAKVKNWVKRMKNNTLMAIDRILIQSVQQAKE